MKHPKEWLYPYELLRNDDWIFTGPRNTYDTNYHLINRTTNVDHLIDSEDVWESGISPRLITSIDDELSLLLELSWKKKTYQF